MRKAENYKLKTVVRGFTLVEMIVAVGIFMFVMVIAVGSLVAIIGADRKAQAAESVVDNLRFALDDVSRNVRTGGAYNCTDGLIDTKPPGGSLTTPSNCSTNGSYYVAFTDQNGNQVIYWYADAGFSAAYCGAGYSGCLLRSVNQGPYLPITSSEIAIDAAKFYVTGAPPLGSGDTYQPKLTIVLSAHISQGLNTPTVLHLQTSVTQRNYDD